MASLAAHRGPLQPWAALGAQGVKLRDGADVVGAEPRNHTKNAVPAITMLITTIRSSAPLFCSWPLARRTIFQLRSRRIASAIVPKIVVSIPTNATRIPKVTEPVAWKT